jgi:hypothetical protein
MRGAFSLFNAHEKNRSAIGNRVWKVYHRWDVAYFRCHSSPSILLEEEKYFTQESYT